MDNVEQLSAVQRRVAIDLPQAEVQADIDQRLKRLARTVRVSGFRPGKVPLKLVDQRYGDEVRSEVINERVSNRLGQIAAEHALDLAGVLNIEQVEGDDQNLKFSATVEIMPEVVIGDLSGVTIDKPTVELNEPEVDKTLEILRAQRRRLEPVERAAEKGDVVTIDFTGTLDGQPFEGGTAKQVTVELGQGRLLVDFESNLEGLKVGDSKTFPLTFPEDYHQQELAGRNVEFAVNVTRVAEVQLPEVNEAFAKELGIADGSMDGMRKEVMEHLKREVRQRVRSRLRKQVLDALIKVSPLEVPQSLVGEEIRGMMASAHEELKSRGAASLAQNLQPQQFEGQARERVALSLLVRKLVDTENLRATQEQVETRAKDQSQSFEDSEQVYQWLLDDPERRREIEALASEDNVIDWVLGHAQVVEKPMNLDDLLSAS